MLLGFMSTTGIVSIIIGLIVIIIALMTLMALGVYRWICRGVDERVENRLKEHGNVLSTRLHASTGFVFLETLSEGGATRSSYSKNSVCFRFCKRIA